jgi:hypothetical protein
MMCQGDYHEAVYAIQAEHRSVALSISYGQLQDAEQDVKARTAASRPVPAGKRVAGVKRAAAEPAAPEVIEKVRRASGKSVPVSTPEQSEQILRTLWRFDGGVQATATVVPDGNLKCSACAGIYIDNPLSTTS